MSDSLLDAARFKSTREVERLLADAFPQPDVPSALRAVPTPLLKPQSELAPANLLAQSPLMEPSAVDQSAVDQSIRPQSRPLSTFHASTRHTIAPIAPTRYLLKVTLSQDTEEKLRRAQALMRHTIPGGEMDAILNRALTLLLDQLCRAKMGRARKPHDSRTPHAVGREGRYIPAAVRREVWERDGGRCVFEGTAGACGETAFLEVHHVIPFAARGASTVANLELRCRAHNAYEARLIVESR